MTTPAQFWNQIHPSVFHEAAGPLRAAEVSPRPRGALRYRCPINGSFVLVTDEETLGRFARDTMRLRCNDCGEMHLLTQPGHASVTARETSDPPPPPYHLRLRQHGIGDATRDGATHELDQQDCAYRRRFGARL